MAGKTILSLEGRIRSGVSEIGRTIEYVTCPFCETEVTTYAWSRAGSGKRCQCGAILGYYTASKWDGENG